MEWPYSDSSDEDEVDVDLDTEEEEAFAVRVADIRDDLEVERILSEVERERGNDYVDLRVQWARYDERQAALPFRERDHYQRDRWLRGERGEDNAFYYYNEGSGFPGNSGVVGGLTWRVGAPTPEPDAKIPPTRDDYSQLLGVGGDRMRTDVYPIGALSLGRGPGIVDYLRRVIRAQTYRDVDASIHPMPGLVDWSFYGLDRPYSSPVQRTDGYGFDRAPAPMATARNIDYDSAAARRFGNFLGNEANNFHSYVEDAARNQRQPDPSA